MKELIHNFQGMLEEVRASLEQRKEYKTRQRSRWLLLNVCPTLHNVEIDKPKAADILGISQQDLEAIISSGELQYLNTQRQTLGLIDILSTDVIMYNRKNILQ